MFSVRIVGPTVWVQLYSRRNVWWKYKVRQWNVIVMWHPISNRSASNAESETRDRRRQYGVASSAASWLAAPKTKRLALIIIMAYVCRACVHMFGIVVSPSVPSTWQHRCSHRRYWYPATHMSHTKLSSGNRHPPSLCILWIFVCISVHLSLILAEGRERDRFIVAIHFCILLF